MIEKIVQDLVDDLASGGAHFDIVPAGVARPYITLQQVGGAPVAYLSGESGCDIVRMQIDVFGDSRTQANEVMTSLRQRLCGEPLLARPVGAPFSNYESNVNTYRRSCDFYILAKI
ncbi:DUF3168 domain-containing protein [Herbaspirillum autotrophicum]|uniref:DUF3168 domain-containing protein n=1 Tax=Herbaspirillum autotrophicum TaxID=180195 RepID=UPI00067B53D7|nr:DUF3168 domain-containing protein [Herbaspirillum autotrophicum]